MHAACKRHSKLSNSRKGEPNGPGPNRGPRGPNRGPRGPNGPGPNGPGGIP